MQVIRIELGFEAAHRLTEKQAPCDNIHGHSYKVFFEFVSDVDVMQYTVPMFLDFKEAKAECRRVVNAYDHALVLQKDDELIPLLEEHTRIVQLDTYPTAEAMCYEFFYAIHKSDVGKWLRAVEVYETPTSMARYEEGGV